MSKSRGNGGGQEFEREEICLEKEIVKSKMNPMFFTEGVGKIGCAVGK